MMQGLVICLPKGVPIEEHVEKLSHLIAYLILFSLTATLINILSCYLVTIAVDETEVESSSSEYQTVKQFYFSKLDHPSWRRLKVSLELKHSTVVSPAYASIWIDGESKLELSTSSTTYENLEGEVDISGLPKGSHLLELKLKTRSGSACNRLLEVYGEL